MQIYIFYGTAKLNEGQDIYIMCYYNIRTVRDPT